MATFRQVQTGFWLDDFVLELTPEEKYFYIYLLTNSRTTQCGIYALSKKFIEIETGYNRETVEKLLKRFVDYGKIYYSEKTREIMIINWARYNFINSRNTIACMNKELKEVRNDNFIKIFYTKCREFEYPVDLIFKDIFLEVDGKLVVKNGSKCCGDIPKNIDDEDINIEVQNYSNKIVQASNCNDDSENFQGAYKGLEAPMKDLGEEEEKEEEQQQQLINKCNKTNNEISEVVEVFNNNIHLITPMEFEKIADWCECVEAEVVIFAIQEAVNHNGRNMSYINSILNKWLSLGFTKIEAVVAYKRDWEDKHKAKKKVLNGEVKANAGAYKVIDTF